MTTKSAPQRQTRWGESSRQRQETKGDGRHNRSRRPVRDLSAPVRDSHAHRNPERTDV